MCLCVCAYVRAESVSGQTMKLLNQTLALPYHQSVTVMMLLCIALCAWPGALSLLASLDC